MDQQHFTDGIGRIAVIEGIVRLDLFAYEADANGQPRPVLTQRLLMSVESFLRSSEKILETRQAIIMARQATASAPQQSAPAQNSPPLTHQNEIENAPPSARSKPFP